MRAIIQRVNFTKIYTNGFYISNTKLCNVHQSVNGEKTKNKAVGIPKRQRKH